MFTLVYRGSPYNLSVDQGRNHMSDEIREQVAADGFQVKQEPIGTQGSIGTVELYHAK